MTRPHINGKINDRAAASDFADAKSAGLEDAISDLKDTGNTFKRGLDYYGMFGKDAQKAAENDMKAEFDDKNEVLRHSGSLKDSGVINNRYEVPEDDYDEYIRHSGSLKNSGQVGMTPDYDQASDADIPDPTKVPDPDPDAAHKAEWGEDLTNNDSSFLSTLYKITPEFVKMHPWAVGLGAVATGAALLAAYSYWKKKKGQSNSVTEEMCVLYPLVAKYSKSLNESYSLSNYNSYINASKRMNKIAPYIYNMMINEDDSMDFDRPGPVGMRIGNAVEGDRPGPYGTKVYTDTIPVPQEMHGIQNVGVPGAGRMEELGYNHDGSDILLPDPDAAHKAEWGEDLTNEDTKSILQSILEFFKRTGDPAIKAFLSAFDISIEWVKAHPGISGASALIAILGTYGTYKLIKLYKEKKETGEVDAEKIEESIDMLKKFRYICESSCDPYISEVQKYKNITILCNLIDSDL